MCCILDVFITVRQTDEQTDKQTNNDENISALLDRQKLLIKDNHF